MRYQNEVGKEGHGRGITITPVPPGDEKKRRPTTGISWVICPTAGRECS